MRSKKNYIFVTIYCILTCLSIAMAVRSMIIVQHDALKNGIQNTDYCSFIINGQDSMDFSFLYTAKDLNVSFMKSTSSDYLNCYEVIYSSDSFYPITSGHGFTLSIFDSNDKAAIVGRDIYESVSENNHIMCFNSTYPVIGQYQFDDQAALSVFFTNGRIRSVDCSGVFMIDGATEKEIYDLYSIIEENAQQQNAQIIKYEEENGSIMNVLKSSKAFYNIIIVMCILYGLSIWCLTYLWIRTQRHWITVHWLCGRDNRERMILSVLVLSLLSILISIFFILVIYKHRSIPLFMWYTLGLSLIGNIALSVIYSVCMKKNLLENYKGLIT